MKKLLYIIFLTMMPVFNLQAVWVPEKPTPPRLVNDLAHMLSDSEVNSLEQKLVAFNDSTTTQIVVVTVPSLNGEDKAMVATEIGHRWGVGQKDKDNGIVILIKPKSADSKGEAFIATGYGLEGVIPDAIADRIVENEIIPKFKQEDYYGGIDDAVNIIMQLSLGEFSAKEYEKRTSSKALPGGIFFLIILLFFILNLVGGARRVNKRSIGQNLPLWILLSMLGSSSGSRTRHSGSNWGSFSSGSGSFGGGGGFGGFGGGGFGGGGAGGSW
jgi:uncharacterized protein